MDSKINYEFNRFVGDTQMELTKQHSTLKAYFDINTATFYFKRFIIHPSYIPQGSILENYEGSNFLVHSDQFSLFQIFEARSKGILKCKNADIEMKEKKIKIENLIFVNTENLINKDFAYKLVGEYVMHVKNQNKYLLMLDEKEFWKKTNAQDLIWEIVGPSKIEGIQECLVWAKLQDGQLAYCSFPIFCLINQLSLDASPQVFVGKEITIYLVNNKHCFKLESLKPKPEFELSIEAINNEFHSEVEPKIEYKNNNLKDRIVCSEFRQVFEKPGFNSKEHFISQPIVNKNLASVVALGIFEHLIRFKSDLYFRQNIEKKLTEANVDHIYRDFPKILKSESVNDLHQNITHEELGLIKRMGEGLLSLLDKDIETYEGIQELCDITGCCIHFRNFTEEFKQVKIVPTHYEIKRRPIINLGKYFNDYFLIYPEEMMISDGFFKPKNSPKNSPKNNPKNKQKSKAKRNFPYYDENFEKEEKLLSCFIKGMINRVKKIIKKLQDKILGKNIDSEIPDFNKISILYKNYFAEKFNNKSGGKITKKFENLNFKDILYNISAKKYFCNCGCKAWVDETIHSKKICACNKEYSRDHLNQLDPNTACYCQNLRVRDILIR